MTTTYPHSPGCSGCRAALACNYCGAPVQRRDRCTNGRCTRCHSHVCTPGGAYEPEHGSGLTRAEAIAAGQNEGRGH